MVQSSPEHSSLSAPLDPRVKSLSVSLSVLDRLRRVFASRPMLAAVQVEQRLHRMLARSGLPVTRIALGGIFLWFGILKFLPTVTPVDALAKRTLTIITFHQFRPEICLHVLAVFECIIGMGLLAGRFLRLTLGLLFLQMPGTFLPLILLRHETWIRFPVFPTLEGQYIIKNLVLIAAGVVVASTLRGGTIIAHPEVAQQAERAELAMEEHALRAVEEQALGKKDES